MMKKLFCLAIAAMMLLTLSVPAFAEEPATEPTINDSLISWWNFEGETEADTLKDKATAGESADDLTKNGTGTAITEGVAYVPSASENSLQLTAANADLVDVSSMTVYMKAKYSGNNTDFADLFSYQGLYRIYKLNDNKSTEGAVLEASAFASKNNNSLGTVRVRPQSDGAVGIQQNEWFYLALTMEIDENNKGTAILYVSKDGLTYSKSETTMEFTAEVLADLKTRQENAETTVALGKLISTSSTPTPDRGVSYWFDDVRIYNKALTQTEIATIIPNSLELRDASEIPSEPSTPSTPDDDGTPSTPDDGTPSTPSTPDDGTPSTPSTPNDGTPSNQETEAATDNGTETVANNGTADNGAEEEAGCSSVMGSGMAMLAALACGICVLKKKKQN